MQGKTNDEVRSIYNNGIASLLKDSVQLISFSGQVAESDGESFNKADKQVNDKFVPSKTVLLSEVIDADGYASLKKDVCEAMINIDANQIITNDGITLTENSNFLDVEGKVISLPKNSVLPYLCDNESYLVSIDYLKSFQIGNQVYKIKAGFSGSGWINFLGYANEAGTLYSSNVKTTDPSIVYSINQFRSANDKTQVILTLEKGKLLAGSNAISQKQKVSDKTFTNSCTSGGGLKDYVAKLITNGLKSKLNGTGYVFENCDGSEKQVVTSDNTSTTGKPVIIFLTLPQV